MKINYKSIIDSKIHFTEKTELENLNLNHKYFKLCARLNKFQTFDKAEDFYKAFKADETKLYLFFVKDCVSNCFRECQNIYFGNSSVDNYQSLNPEYLEHDFYRFDFSEFTIEFED